MVLEPDFFDDIDFPQLRELSLDQVDVCDIEEIHLQAPHLISLRLSCVSIEVDALIDVLAQLSITLQILEVEILHISSFQNPAVFQLRHLQSLTTKSLSAPVMELFLRPDQYPVIRHWEYQAHDLLDGGAQLGARLSQFVAGAATLESITALCGHQDLQSVVLALDPTIAGSPCTPELKSLNLTLRNNSVHPLEAHQTIEMRLLDLVLTMLIRRQQTNLNALESLSVQTCNPKDWHILAFTKLVNDVMVQPCEWRSKAEDGDDEVDEDEDGDDGNEDTDNEDEADGDNEAGEDGGEGYELEQSP